MDKENQAFFPDYLERLENLNKNLDQAIQNLPQAALDWIPGPEMNSLAVLLAHTAGSLRYWIGDVALGEPSGRVREREFQTHGVDQEEFKRRLDEVLEFVRHNLSRLDIEDLDRQLNIEDESKQVTCGWALLHALEHGYLHLGHIQITRQLWENRRNVE